MANDNKVLVTKSKLVSIGDAIRTKTETTDTLTLDEMAQKINDISGSGPQLYAPTLTYTKGATTFTIGYSNANGSFAQGIYVYLNEELVDTQNSLPTTYSLSLQNDKLYEYYVEVFGEGMKTSVHSNVLDIMNITITATLDSNITSSNTATTAYYGDSYTTTFTVADGYYLGSHIEVKINGELSEDFEYDPNTGVFTIPLLRGKLEYTLSSSTKPFLQAPNLGRDGFVATWTAVDNATSYEFHIFDSHTDHVLYTGSNLTYDFTSYINALTTSGVHYIYVIAKADGYQDSSERDKIEFYYNPSLELDSVFENNSWGDIAQGFSLGLAQEVGWKLGDTKNLLVGTSEYPVRIVDMNNGKYSTASGITNNAVLMFSKLYNTYYAMNSSQKTYDGITSYTAGGWLNSDMRLNNIQKIWDNIGDEEFKSACMKVRVGSAKYGGSGQTNTNAGGAIIYSDDKIFLPAQSELFGSSETFYSYNSERSLFPQFDLYKNNSTNDFKKMYTLSGTNYWWWTRSPYCYDASYFCDVGSGGSADVSSAYRTGGVTPCFAM